MVFVWFGIGLMLGCLGGLLELVLVLGVGDEFGFVYWLGF